MKTKLLLTTVLIVISMAGADYTISWYTIDGGGGTSSSGPYELSGTVGQPDADYHYAAPYELLGGFWIGGPLCIVDLGQFATFASYWLEATCNGDNDNCGGANLDGENGVDIEDLNLLVAEWLNICPVGWPLE